MLIFQSSTRHVKSNLNKAENEMNIMRAVSFAVSEIKKKEYDVTVLPLKVLAFRTALLPSKISRK